MDSRPKKFIGGAERARRQAQSRGWEPPSQKRRRLQREEERNQRQHSKKRNRQSQKSTTNYSIVPLSTKKLRSSERFFASLLEAPNFPKWNTLRLSSNVDHQHSSVLEYICTRLGLGSPPSRHHRCSGVAGSSECVLPHTDNRRRFFQDRAILVIEEARHELGEALAKRTGESSWTEVKLDSFDLDQKRTRFLRLGLSKSSGRFTPEELFQQRPGSCFELEAAPKETSKTKKRVRMLCSVAPGKPGSVSKLVLIVYESSAINQLILLGDQTQDESLTQKSLPLLVRWKIRFCVSLISHCRQFEACDFGSVNHHKGKNALVKMIMGQKEATHIRFCDSEDEEGEEEIVGYVTEETDGEKEVVENENTGNSQVLSTSSFTGLKTLNPTQEHAAEQFCSSNATDTKLELIQGPPGTGKTTFVVSVLARLLAQARENDARQRHKRILVTAPTNKALSVIAKRFLESCPGLLDHHGIPVILIGVQDKLLEPDENGKIDKGLKRIFCYTWIDTLAGEYEQLLEENSREVFGSNSLILNDASEMVGKRGLSRWPSKVFPSKNKIDTFMVADDSDSNTENEEEESKNKHVIHSAQTNSGSVSVAAKARALHVRLVRNLPRWSETSGAANLSRQILTCLDNGEISDASSYMKALVKIFRQDADESSSSFSTQDDNDDEEERGVRVEDALPELLATARVIFCTLSTAGISLMKQTRRIDDWIVDEAAAATEPELMIPLHLNPSRLLVVGDPKQLPPSVSSSLSQLWGLGRSLQERLTVDLGKAQTMLDVQYRMKPEIAKFPSQNFYNGQLTNGENVTKASYGALYSSPCSDRRCDFKDLVRTTPSFCFFQVNGKERQSHTGSYYNTEEALVLVKLLKSIRVNHSQQTKNTAAWCSPVKLRVITFYSAQVANLRQILRKEGLQGVLVATVDSSQGCEADLVVLSFVRTTGAGFLRDDRRMNVGLTRARHKLICLGDLTNSTWSLGHSTTSSTTLMNLIQDVRSRGCLSLAFTATKQAAGDSDGA